MMSRVADPCVRGCVCALAAKCTRPVCFACAGMQPRVGVLWRFLVSGKWRRGVGGPDADMQTGLGAGCRPYPSAQPSPRAVSFFPSARVHGFRPALYVETARAGLLCWARVRALCSPAAWSTSPAAWGWGRGLPRGWVHAHGASLCSSPHPLLIRQVCSHPLWRRTRPPASEGAFPGGSLHCSVSMTLTLV